MSTTYLIDGYNLLHALGVLKRKMGPGGLEQARLFLLGSLHGAFEEQSSNVTIVFDAAGARPGASGDEDYHGLHVRYAVGKEQADDLIEELIQQEARPKHLTVVSDDHRLQKAARRRRANYLGCAEFFDVLQEKRRKRTSSLPAPEDKQQGLSAREKDHWLKQFGDLENDPEFKDFFETF
jgi:predicted RNA-binding protein with PIN domain